MEILAGCRGTDKIKSEAGISKFEKTNQKPNHKKQTCPPWRIKFKSEAKSPKSEANTTINNKP